MSKFYNTSLDRVPNSGGSNKVIIPAATTIRGGTGTGGATSVPCKEAWLSARAGDTTVRVTIGTTCTNDTGIPVPEQAAATDSFILRIPIDDLNQLYFFGVDGDIIDILYRC